MNKAKELLWEHITYLNNQIKEEKALRYKHIVKFNRLFQKELRNYQWQILI